MIVLYVVVRNGVFVVVIEEFFVGVGKEMLEEWDGRGWMVLYLVGWFIYWDIIWGLFRLGVDLKRVLEKEIWEGVE